MADEYKLTRLICTTLCKITQLHQSGKRQPKVIPMDQIRRRNPGSRQVLLPKDWSSLCRELQIQVARQ